MHQAFKHTIQQDAFRVSQSRANTTGSPRQFFLAVGLFERCFWFLLYVQGLESEVFSIIYLCVACSSCCYFVLPPTYQSNNYKWHEYVCVSEKNECVNLPEWDIKYCKFSNLKSRTPIKAWSTMKDGDYQRYELVR